MCFENQRRNFAKKSDEIWIFNRFKNKDKMSYDLKEKQRIQSKFQKIRRGKY